MTSFLRRWVSRLRDLVAWDARDRDIEQEMAFHRDALAQEHRDAGRSEVEARLAAERTFGGLLRMKERGHEIRGAGILEDGAREARHACRRLVRSPAFTAATLATLALAIGANVAIFSVVYRVVLNPLPYPASDRLLQLEHAIPRINVPSGIGLTTGLYELYRDRARTLEAVAVYRVGEATLSGAGEPQRVRLVRATPTLASVLRVPPVLGRWFTDREGAWGTPPVAVLSYSLWQRMYGGDSQILGRPVTVDGVPATVIGVMPATFAIPDTRVDLWVPDPIAPAAGFGLPFDRVGVALLRAGATLADARAELSTIIAGLPAAFPGDPGVLGNVGDGGLRSAPRTLQEVLVGGIAGALWILLASVGLVLLVACANVANLFLVRAESRQREVAVRRALGATGPRLARLFFADSLLISTVAGAVGVGLAWGAVRLLIRLGPPTLPRLHEIQLDGASAVYACGLTLLAAMVLGAMPLARQGSLAAPVRDAGPRLTATPARHRVRHLLMGAQVATALVLLVAAGLLIRSFHELRAFDAGFDPTSTLTFRIGLPDQRYPSREAAVAAHGAVLDGLAALPGVVGASAATGLPLADGCFGNTVLLRGRTVDGGAPPLARFCAVAGGYVEALRNRLLRGRGLDRDDVRRGRPNAVISQAFARVLFGDEDPIGRQVRSNAPPRGTPQPDGEGGFTWEGMPPWLTIVGVVADVPFRALGETDPLPVVYLPMSLAGGPDIPRLAMLGPNVSVMSYVVRSSLPASVLLPSIRRAVDEVDPALAVADVQTLEDVVARGTAQMAFTMVLLAMAAGVALAIGAIGVYGVIAYVVSQRTTEIGVRLAMGAEPAGVTSLILRQSGAAVLAGVAVGAGIAVAAARVIEALLYNVEPRDPAVLASAVTGLLLVALAASWLPARRAAAVNPMEALRAE